MDISMPGLNGLKAAKKIKQVAPKTKILTLTRHTDDGYLQQLLKAGVNGYVLKQSAPSELINAIRAVAADPVKPSASVNRVEEDAMVRQAQKGDLAAYDELVRRYQQRIYATVYHMTSNHEDANDLAQEAFIKAYQALSTFKGGSSFYTWVYRIAVNKTLNFLKFLMSRIFRF